MTKNGVGLTLGGKVGRVSVSPKGKVTVGASIPGTGISYSQQIASGGEKRTVEQSGSLSAEGSFAQTRWYQKTGWIIFFLIVFPPIGVAMTWLSKNDWSKTAKIVATVLSSLLLIYAVGCSSSGSSAPAQKYREGIVFVDSGDYSKVDTFIASFNEASDSDIINAVEVRVQDRDSGYYDTHFRLQQFTNAHSKVAELNGHQIIVINCGDSFKDQMEIYYDTDSLEERAEFTRIATRILATPSNYDADKCESVVNKILALSPDARGYDGMITEDSSRHIRILVSATGKGSAFGPYEIQASDVDFTSF